jgi:hypothetical protein
MYVLTLRNTKTGEYRFWRSRQLKTVMQTLKRHVHRRDRRWSSEEDAALMASYSADKAVEIGRRLGRTPNAVIGRYHRLKKKQQRELKNDSTRRDASTGVHDQEGEAGRLHCPASG